MRTPRSSRATGPLAKLGAVALAFALAGCAGGSPGEPSETTLTKTQGPAQTTVTYFAEGDTVTKQVTENVVNYELGGIADRDDAKQQVSGLVEKFKGIPGVEHSIEFGDTELTETVTLTYAELDVAKLGEATGAGAAGDPEAAKKVSLEEAVTSLTADGFSEVK